MQTNMRELFYNVGKLITPLTYCNLTPTSKIICMSKSIKYTVAPTQMVLTSFLYYMYLIKAEPNVHVINGIMFRVVDSVYFSVILRKTF